MGQYFSELVLVSMICCLVSTAPKEKSDGKMTKNKKKKIKKKLKKKNELLEQQMLHLQELEQDTVSADF